MRYLLYFLLITPAFLFFSCASKPAKTVDDTSSKEPVASMKAANFNADSAYYFVSKQVSFGPRVMNSKAHEKCAAWLDSTLHRYTPNVIVQKFTAKAYDGTTLNCKNIIASFGPKNPKRVLLCAHWDSRPYADNDPDTSNYHKPIDGANDGASGVGVLIEIARQLSISPPYIGVDILLLDAEDYGAPQFAAFTGTDDWALGSQFWSRYPHTPSYSARYGILLDMVGGENAVFALEGTSMYYAPDIAQKVWNTGSAIGYSNYFTTERTNAITDDHVYINQLRQIPTIDIIQSDPSTNSGFNQQWHTVNDNMKHINKSTLMAVGQTVITVVRNEK